jgi:hypothetical protein
LRHAPRGRLCPVCLRRTAQGRCAVHGPWRAQQLLTSRDRRRAERENWQQFEPCTHACPRCLGEVTEGQAGFKCVAHGDGDEPHGPFRVQELLAPTAQRESAAIRRRHARRVQSRRRDVIPWSLQLPDPARSARVVASASVIAATLAFLVR